MEQKNQSARRLGKATRSSAEERRGAPNGALPATGKAEIRLNPKPIAAAPARGGVEVVETYFDADGRPIKRKSLGAARIARCYDAKGNQVEEAYFNAEGKPTACKGLGAARISWRYDERGNRVEAALFGADGALLRRKSSRGKRAFESV